MLSVEERHEIEHEIAHYEHPAALRIDALKVIQKYRGWVTDEGLADVSGILGVSVADLEGVATFYNLLFRQPVGKHVILVCDSVSCWIMGYETIVDYLKKKLGVGLGQTTADGKFTLLPVPCLGCCDHAPAMLVGDELFGDLTPGKIDEILRKY